MFRHMDEEEINILSMNDLKMVHFYTIEDSIPAIAVIYGDNEQMNYCLQDKYYDTFVKQILKCVEKQKGINDIMMDKETAAVFEAYESSLYSKEDERYEAFKPELSREVPIFNPLSYMDKYMVPIAKYIISEIYAMFDKNLVWTKNYRAWHSNGKLIGMRGNHECVFPFEMHKLSASEYVIKLSNFLDIGEVIDIDVAVDRYGIKIMFDSTAYSLSGVSTYDINYETGEVNENTTINSEGYLIYTREEPVSTLKLEEVNELKECLQSAGIYDFLRPELIDSVMVCLPWGQIISFNHKKDASELRQVTEYSYALITRASSEMIVRSYETTVVRGIESGTELDTCVCSTDIYSDNKNGTTIQVFFDDRELRLSGHMKYRLGNKYFVFTDRIPVI